jgi:hypothetical protein
MGTQTFTATLLLLKEYRKALTLTQFKHFFFDSFCSTVIYAPRPGFEPRLPTPKVGVLPVTLTRKELRACKSPSQP